MLIYSNFLFDNGSVIICVLSFPYHHGKFRFLLLSFVQLDEPDLFFEAEEGVTDFDECYNPRLIEGVAMNADGIGK